MTIQDYTFDAGDYLFSLMEDVPVNEGITKPIQRRSSAKSKTVEPVTTGHVELRKLFDSMTELERQEALEVWSEWLLDRAGITRTHARGTR